MIFPPHSGFRPFSDPFIRWIGPLHYEARADISIFHETRWHFLSHTFFQFCLKVHQLRGNCCLLILNRPGVGGAVLQTALSLINWFIHSVTAPFPPNLQETFFPKPLQLGSWHVMCRMSQFNFYLFWSMWWILLLEGLLSTGPTLSGTFLVCLFFFMSKGRKILSTFLKPFRQS